MLHQVGAGVLGPVFRALDPADERAVAIKLFRLDLTPEQAGDLAAELARLVELMPAHDGLVRPIAAGMEGNLPFLVSDYAGADSIDQRLRRKVPTALDEVTTILEQVAAALDAASPAGIHHGALHPRDVLVTTVGTVRLTGSGVARALERVGYRPPFRRPYAAPERVAGRKWDQRADVFAIGVLALELVTGRRPLLPENGASFNLLPDDDPRADAVREALVHALEEDPARRDATSLAWVARLRAAVQAGDRSYEARPPVAPREGPHLQDASPMRLPGAPEATSELDVELPWELPESAVLADAALAAAATADSFPPPSESAFALIERAMTADTPASSDDEVPEPSTQERWPTEGAAALDVALHAEPDEPLARLDVVRSAATGPAAADGDFAGGYAESRAEERGHPVVPSSLAPSAAGRRSPWLALVAAAVVCAALGLYYLSADRTLELAPGEVSVPQTTDEPPAAVLPSTPVAGDTEKTPPPAMPAPAPAPVPRASAPRTAGVRPSSVPAAKPAPAPASPVTGRLLMRSSPAGATVTVDGVARGQTPVVVRDLGLGTHKVTVALPGYTTATREIVLTAGAPAANVVVDLLAGPATARSVLPSGSPGPAPRQSPVPPPAAVATASLQVVSNPPGARVFLNGRAVGTTPLRVSNLPSAPHAVRLQADGYREWARTIELDAGLVAYVSATLEPAGER